MVFQCAQNIQKILPHIMGQHKLIMQPCTPRHQRGLIGLMPKGRNARPNQQRLQQIHLRMGRHFKPAHLQQAQPPALAVGAIEFINTKF